MEIGDRIGTYIIRDELAQGTFTKTFLVRESKGRREAVLKILRPEFAADSALVARFQEQAKAASGLQQTNIASVIDCGEQEGNPYLVTEFVEGQTLREMMALGGPVPYEIAVLLLLDIARGLEQAHERSLFHGRIRPVNIILSRPGILKITDFGLAWEMEALMAKPEGGLSRERIRYASPEQVSGRPAAAPSDLFSLGVVGYELLAVRPFGGASAEEVARAILERKPEPLEDLGPPVPGPLAALIDRLMEKAEDQRGTLPAAREQLEEIVRHLGLNRGRDLLREFLHHPLEGRKRAMEERVKASRRAAVLRTGIRRKQGPDTASLKARLGGILNLKLTFPLEKAPPPETGMTPKVETARPPAPASGRPPVVEALPRAAAIPAAKDIDLPPAEASSKEEEVGPVPAGRRPARWKRWKAGLRVARPKIPIKGYAAGLLTILVLGVATVALTTAAHHHKPPAPPAVGSGQTSAVPSPGAFTGPVESEVPAAGLPESNREETPPAAVPAPDLPSDEGSSYHVVCKPLKVLMSVDGTRVEAGKTDSFEITLQPGNHVFHAVHPGLRLDEVIEYRTAPGDPNHTLILDLRARRVTGKPGG